MSEKKSILGGHGEEESREQGQRWRAGRQSLKLENCHKEEGSLIGVRHLMNNRAFWKAGEVIKRYLIKTGTIAGADVGPNTGKFRNVQYKKHIIRNTVG